MMERDEYLRRLDEVAAEAGRSPFTMLIHAGIPRTSVVKIFSEDRPLTSFPLRTVVQMMRAIGRRVTDLPADGGPLLDATIDEVASMSPDRRQALAVLLGVPGAGEGEPDRG